MATEDKLDEIYQAFVVAREERDEAMEGLADALSSLKAANSKYNAAVSELADYLGESDINEGTDMGDVFNTISGGGLRLTSSSLSKLFGDLF
jgi:hypothetical protein